MTAPEDTTPHTGKHAGKDSVEHAGEHADSQIAAILQQTKTIAVIGASDNWKRPSFYVMKYLLSQGYQIIPVNPRLAGQTILGQTCFESLADIPQQIDMVDIFRPASDCPDIVEQAISIGAKTVWMQIGIVSPQTANLRTASEGRSWRQHLAPVCGA